MKLTQYTLMGLAVLGLAACQDINEQELLSGEQTAEQMQATNQAIATRTEATFSGMFTMMGEPAAIITTRKRADDFAFLMAALSAEAEAADFWYPNSNYNWFSACGEWSTRNPDYANPTIRYTAAYKQISIANNIIKSYPEGTTDSVAQNRIAQARALRAFDYMSIAYLFQFNYADHKDKPCLPLVSEKTADATNNPRATVEQVYQFIIDDLNYACQILENHKPANKNHVSGAVAYGLRARAWLAMEEFGKAAADAEKAITLSGLTPASITDVSTPAFCDINEKNWLWGYDMTTDMAKIYSSATVSSWLSSFSGDGYAAGGGVYAHINELLYDKIADTDVRKGWWVNEDLHSPLLKTITWNGVTGDDIVPLVIKDVKMAMDAYTNVKFGMVSGIGSTLNDNDFPLMRVEELILIKAEGLAKSGQEAQAKTVLSDFVKTYRDPSYDIDAQLSKRSLADEIWFQRRIELWGEGFAMSDIMRLKKPVVRFHGEATTYPDAFRFNVPYGDPYTLLRFPTTETDNNKGIVNNEGGAIPQPGQNPTLRDGVTD